ncbi:PEP-CTERM sorting domain-containing protein [Erythrobacter litoralis]|uniref:PEPxxWA-CTERM sorting domain-containing protein n=1 Tax=Erythrobacter litoralis TaxID=39960 RepID=UPI0024355CD0|nr:PEPxxWA-CTERM sorting domain-containing protein [Erythrobacter litoralis]MDG6079064.1 PEP-CTERM sorting domain-containing protein [Erythrobacter litoralis]
MNRTLLSALAGAAALCVATPALAATTIDFETTPSGALTVPGDTIGDTYVAEGFSVSGAIFQRCEGGCPTPEFGVFAASSNFIDPITVSFFDPISFFSFENVAQSSGRATAFAADGTNLGVVDFFGFPAVFSLEFDGIASVQFTTLFEYGVDNFSFTANAGSGGGGNAGAIPEPSTWALLLLGFFGTGYAMRRRPNRNVKIRFG